eukprot:m.1102982 g.1102982  ORF g.1102982 m.1102982 type:complete len:1444 (+) comp24328_c0_seq3:215-4546(+)
MQLPKQERAGAFLRDLPDADGLCIIDSHVKGQVFKGHLVGGGAAVAVKVIDYVEDDHDEEEYISAEILINKSVATPPCEGINPFLGAYRTSWSSNFTGQNQGNPNGYTHSVVLVHEFCAGGSIADFVASYVNAAKQSQTQPWARTFTSVPEEVVSYVLYKILVGLARVHDDGYVHCDIKGANIVFTAAGEPRLTDFGVADYIGNTVVTGDSTVGTAYWMAPEICACELSEGYEYDKRCDIWSLGITAIELAEGAPPLAGTNAAAAIHTIPSKPPPTLSNPSKWSDAFRNFLQTCLVKDFRQRPTVHELLLHPFVATAANADVAAAAEARAHEELASVRAAHASTAATRDGSETTALATGNSSATGEADHAALAVQYDALVARMEAALVQIGELQKNRTRLSSVVDLLRQELRAVHDLKNDPSAFVAQLQWQDRRSQKVDKLELRNLEQQRDEEIKAKLAAEGRIAEMQANADAALEETRHTLQERIAALEKQLSSAQEEVGRLQKARNRVSHFEVPNTPGLFNYRQPVPADAVASPTTAAPLTLPPLTESPAADPDALFGQSQDLPGGTTPRTPDVAVDPAVSTPVTPEQRARAGSSTSSGGGQHDLAGWVMVPRPEGVRKGWRQMWLTVAANGLMLFHERPQMGGVPAGKKPGKGIPDKWYLVEGGAEERARIVIDMHSAAFGIDTVVAADAIHAGTKLIAQMFKIKSDGPNGTQTEMLVLTPTPEHKQYWMAELDALLKNLALQDATAPTPFTCYRLASSQHFSDVRRMLAAARIGTRLLIGTAQGLHTLDVNGKVATVADVKRVTHIEIVALQHSFIICAARKDKPQLRLFGINAALRGRENEGTKIPESKGLTLFATGPMGEGKTCLAFVLRNKIRLCEIVLQNYKFVGDIDITGEPSVLDVVNGHVCVAHDAMFTLYDVHERTPISIVAKTDPSLRFLFTTKVDNVDLAPVAIFHVAATPGTPAAAPEYLLCFNFAAVFVHTDGRRSRGVELRWLDGAKHFAFRDPYLLCYGENMVQIVHVGTGATVQIIPVSGMRAVSRLQVLFTSTDVDQTWVGMLEDEREKNELMPVSEIVATGRLGSGTRQSAGSSKDKKVRRGMLSFKTSRGGGDVASTPISGPSDFQHVSHVGHQGGRPRSSTTPATMAVRPGATRDNTVADTVGTMAPKPSGMEDYYRVGSPANSPLRPSSLVSMQPATPAPRVGDTVSGGGTDVVPSSPGGAAGPRVSSSSFSKVQSTDPKSSLDSVFRAIAGLKAAEGATDGTGAADCGGVLLTTGPPQRALGASPVIAMPTPPPDPAPSTVRSVSQHGHHSSVAASSPTGRHRDSTRAPRVDSDPAYIDVAPVDDAAANDTDIGVAAGEHAPTEIARDLDDPALLSPPPAVLSPAGEYSPPERPSSYLDDLGEEKELSDSDDDDDEASPRTMQLGQRLNDAVADEEFV